MGWQEIESAPVDGSVIMLRRRYRRRIVSEGLGYWGKLSADAPQRHTQPGNALTAAFPPSPNCDDPRWCTADGRFNFPAPTHWAPA